MIIVKMRTLMVAPVLLALASCGTAVSSAGSTVLTTQVPVGVLPPAVAEAPAGEASTSLPAPTVPPTVPPSAPPSAPPTVDTSVLADVIAGAALGQVPEGTPVRSAGSDQAILYDNGCHLSWNEVTPKDGCFFGDTASNVVVVVTGDSEAAHWFGAFDEAGKANHWKIVMVTKSGCPAADVKVYSAADPNNLYLAYPECPEWRGKALEYIRGLQPQLVVFPMLSRRAIVGVPKKSAMPVWAEGLGRSIDAVKGPATRVLVLGDTPKTNGENVPACVASHMSDVRPCGNDRSAAVDPSHVQGLADTARQHGAAYVDPSNWLCTDTFCPAVIGNAVVYRDKLHLTDRFSRSRGPQVAQAISFGLSGPHA